MKFLLFILLLFVSLGSYAESSYLSYFLKGKKTDKSNRPVANTRFTLIGTNPTRQFFTNSNGEYFVEAIYYKPCLSGGLDLSDRKGIKRIREANGELLIITCEKGSTKIKFNWEEYYSNDLFHTPLSSSTNSKAIDVVDITLTDAPIPSAMINQNEMADEWMSKFRKELRLLCEIPVDSFKRAGKIKRDDLNELFLLPDGRSVSFDDAYSNNEPPELLKCYLGRGAMNGYLRESFEQNEVRMIHIDSLFSKILPDNFDKLFILQNTGTNKHELTKAGFDRRYGCYTFYTNDAGYIEDIAESYDSDYYFY